MAALLALCGVLSSPLAESFAQGLPGKPLKAKADEAKEKAADRKEKREERREDAKDKAEDKTATVEAAVDDKLKPEWKKKRDEWREKRKERGEELRSAIKTKLGEDALKRPAVRAELRVHAMRLARLNRILFLAQAHEKAKIEEKVKALIEKENARHDKRIEALKTEKPTAKLEETK